MRGDYHCRRGLALLLVFLLPLAAGCATVPTRPTELLAQVEVQINNTPTHRDDVASIFPSVQLPARMRIVNPNTSLGGGVTADVPVTVANIGACGTYCGQMRFGTSATGSFVTSLPLTLPRTGAWVGFWVRGNPSASSLTLTDAVLEVREDRTAGNVLARHGLSVTDINQVVSQTPTAVIEIAGTALTLDDYLTWGATSATVRMVTPNTLSGPLNVVLRNAAPAAGADPPGRVVFGLPAGSDPPLLNTMTPTLSLSLPANGAAVRFFVAGQYQQASERDKDAIIEVINPAEANPTKAWIEWIGVMVRIRKDANKLKPNERDRLLQALQTLKAGTTQYADYVQINAQAGSQANSVNTSTPSPAFLPWHRIFLLRFERTLQGLDPSVALPYWRYDQAAPSVFSQHFMGESQTGNGIPTILTAGTNPLNSWAIQRMSSFTPAGNPQFVGPIACRTESESNVLNLLGTQFLNGTQGFWYMEHFANEHAVQAASGQCLGWATGWLAQHGTAVQDPLFFLLHANTDRLWAKWQRQYNRFDPAIPQSYRIPACTLQTGQCLRDTMWPWNSTSAPGGKFAPGLGRVFLPPESPTPADALGIDRAYVWNNSTGQWVKLTMGLGYSYDDVPAND